MLIWMPRRKMDGRRAPFFSISGKINASFRLHEASSAGRLDAVVCLLSAGAAVKVLDKVQRD